MEITVYGKKGCKKCDSFKEKLGLLHLEYAFVDLDNLQEWQDKGNVARSQMAGAMAEYQLADTLPIVLIHDRYYDYSAAIAELKRRKQC